jgi:broad specificity phosphatase PhoE
VTRLILVRHATAAARWGEHLDPGLSDTGEAQARDMAERLHPLVARPVFTSPLRRCQETAAALAHRWGVTPIVEPDVGEIKSPGDQNIETRSTWLDIVLHQTWPELPAEQQAWRDALHALLGSVTDD